MLEAYARAGLGLEPPLADLGCGTGLFAAMLVAGGVIGGTDLGLDWQLGDLRRTGSSGTGFLLFAARKA